MNISKRKYFLAVLFVCALTFFGLAIEGNFPPGNIQTTQPTTQTTRPAN